MSRHRRCIVCLATLLLAAVPLAAQQPTRPPAKTAPKAPAKTAPKAPAKPAPAPPKPEPPPPPPDLSITARYTTGDKTTTSSVLLHGSRQRVGYESDLASVQQCDNARGIQLNTKTRTYLEMPFERAATTAPPPAKTKGGQIKYTTTVTDTNERKDVFGFSARHLKTVIAKEASADACDKKAERVEIDGWYIDLPPALTCTGAPAPVTETRIDPKDNSCRDEVTFVRSAEASRYPVAYSMTSAAGTDPPATTTMEVIKLERTTEDPQQFDIPADYIAVKTVAQLTADHRPDEDGPKKPGVVRVGVAPFANKSGQQVATADLTQALAESLGEVELDIVMLRGETPAAQDAEAQSRLCDYILQNTIAELKKPGKGVMGKIAGTSSEALAAKVDFALLTPGQPKPVYTASERSGGSRLQTAIGAARRISKIVLPLMMGNYGSLTQFASMSGAASPGAMQQTQDPVLSSVFSLVDRATGAKPQENYTSEEAAIAAALQKEVEAVAGELKKKKS